jgi:hypothetical protein
VGTNHLAVCLSSVCLVEEIIDGYDCMMLMAGGRVVDRGSIRSVMAGGGVNRLYGDACRIESEGGRYAMRFVRS